LLGRNRAEFLETKKGGLLKLESEGEIGPKDESDGELDFSAVRIFSLSIYIYLTRTGLLACNRATKIYNSQSFVLL